MIQQILSEFNEDALSQFLCLEKIATELQPRRILEIGSGWGVSASAFLHKTNATMITIDPVPVLKEFDRRTELLGLTPRITRLLGRSGDSCGDGKLCNDKLFLLETINEKFDLIFIDGSHSYNEVCYDLEHCYNKLSDWGVLVVDDFYHRYNYTGNYGVNKAVCEFAKKKNKEFIVHPGGHGIVRFV